MGDFKTKLKETLRSKKFMPMSTGSLENKIKRNIIIDGDPIPEVLFSIYLRTSGIQVDLISKFIDEELIEYKKVWDTFKKNEIIPTFKKLYNAGKTPSSSAFDKKPEWRILYQVWYPMYRLELTKKEWNDTKGTFKEVLEELETEKKTTKGPTRARGNIWDTMEGDFKGVMEDVVGQNPLLGGGESEEIIEGEAITVGSVKYLEEPTDDNRDATERSAIVERGFLPRYFGPGPPPSDPDAPPTFAPINRLAKFLPVNQVWQIFIQKYLNDFLKMIGPTIKSAFNNKKGMIEKQKYIAKIIKDKYPKAPSTPVGTQSTSDQTPIKRPVNPLLAAIQQAGGSEKSLLKKVEINDKKADEEVNKQVKEAKDESSPLLLELQKRLEKQKSAFGKHRRRRSKRRSRRKSKRRSKRRRSKNKKKYKRRRSRSTRKRRSRRRRKSKRRSRRKKFIFF